MPISNPLKSFSYLRLWREVWILLGLCGLLLVTPYFAFAEERDKTVFASSTLPILPETKCEDNPKNLFTPCKVHRQALIGAFIQAAFSTYIIPRNASSNGLVTPFLTDRQKTRHDFMKLQYPWLFEYRYRTEGIPKYVAINKWVKPVRISLGLPNDGKPLPLPSGMKEPKTEHGSDVYSFPEYGTPYPPEFRAAIQDEILRIIPELASATGLPISFMPHEKETPRDLAEIRIVLKYKPSAQTPAGFQRWKTPFKYGDMPRGHSSGGDMIVSFPEDLRSSGFQQTAVTFTPENMYQVEGYLFPNAHNELGMAMCFISDEHPEAMLKALVRECLVRSMGLPDHINVFDEVLRLWNNQAVKPDKLRMPEITEDTKDVLKILYHPAIKPGMDMNEVWKLLVGE